jgi:CheY-like chemotaxis protein
MSEPFHILIADDEEGIRFVLREILTSKGYRVTEAERRRRAYPA